MTLQERKMEALNRIGGTMAYLNLPDAVKEIVGNAPTEEAKVKMLELIAENNGKVNWDGIR